MVFLPLVKTSQFQSTPSAWRVTIIPLEAPLSPLFQSTPSAWRVTGAISRPSGEELISIHTLRVEGDPYTARNGAGH